MLILGWYILTETKSVVLLTLFASLQWIGTLIAPMFGVAGDRLGHRNVLCAMRALYAVQAGLLMVLAFAGAISPLAVFIISAGMNLVRPSDLAMRYALIGETMPRDQLMSATSIERTTVESARVFGALTGAGLFAALGLGAAYTVVTAFYLLAFALTLGVRVERKPASTHADVAKAAPVSAWRDVREGFGYVRGSPVLVPTLLLAFLVNLSAYPLTLGLLPYIVKDVLQGTQTGLGYAAASFALGALSGSIALTRYGGAIAAGRWMFGFAVAWYAMLAVFALQSTLPAAIAALFFAGLAQSFCLVPMSAILLRHAEDRYRGRVLGIRMFAIYGLPVGLLLAGPLIEALGFTAMAMLYCAGGIVVTAAIALRWRQHMWAGDAPGNRR
jgi:predicted MFS family arabinose efflux permease